MINKIIHSTYMHHIYFSSCRVRYKNIGQFLEGESGCDIPSLITLPS